MTDDITLRTTHDHHDDTKENLDKHDEELEDRPVEGTLDDDEVYVEQLQNDEIRIGSDNFGTIVPKAAQVMDYLHRHEKFNNICVWDFVAQVDKVENNKKNNNKKTTTQRTNDNESYCDDNVDNEDELTDNTLEDSEDMEVNEPYLFLSAEEILHSSTKTRPFAELQAGHYESRTHFQRVRRWENQLIPVPMGPKMPIEQYANIARM
ncbi:hypothetical protein BDR07DRAFT_1486224 [Suillus spraguei]|nr:hypothetical protein BDR07DRAFT_1486224 [Suillus spraguei]